MPFFSSVNDFPFCWRVFSSFWPFHPLMMMIPHWVLRLFSDSFSFNLRFLELKSMRYKYSFKRIKFCLNCNFCKFWKCKNLSIRSFISQNFNCDLFHFHYELEIKHKVNNYVILGKKIIAPVILLCIQNFIYF